MIGSDPLLRSPGRGGRVENGKCGRNAPPVRCIGVLCESRRYFEIYVPTRGQRVVGNASKGRGRGRNTSLSLSLEDDGTVRSTEELGKEKHARGKRWVEKSEAICRDERKKSASRETVKR